MNIQRVHLISLNIFRKSPNGKVIVEYGIQLLPRNATDNSVDQSVVRDLVQVLVRSDLVTADNTTVTSIEGQC